MAFAGRYVQREKSGRRPWLASTFRPGRSGTNEMMRHVIGEQLLGRRREPSVDIDRPVADVIRRATQISTRHGKETA
jgi:hypothetical protein